MNGQPPGGRPNRVTHPFIQAIDRLTTNLVGGVSNVIRSVFGAAPNDNEEPVYFPVQGAAVGGGTTQFVPLAAGQQGAVGTVQIDNSGDLIGVRLIGIETDAANAPILTASFTVQIKTDAGGRFITANPTHKGAVVGDPRQSVPWAKNWLIPRNSTLTFTFNELAGVTARIWWAVWGWRVYDAAALNLTRRQG